MALYEDLQWLEDELLEDEEFYEEDYQEYKEEPPRRHRRKVHWEEPESMAEREAVYVEKKKRDKGIRKFKFLAFLELLAILAVIWGWIKWLY